MTAPTGETAKDRRRQWFVGVMAVVALTAILGCVAFVALLIHTQNADHTASSKQSTKIINLEKQHGADILNESQLLQNIGKADTELNQVGVDLFLDAAAACANTVSIANQLHLTVTPCPTISPLPKLPATPTPTIPTTTVPATTTHSASRAAPAAPIAPTTTTAPPVTHGNGNGHGNSGHVSTSGSASNGRGKGHNK